jgi:hypothetical protein
MDVFLMPVRPAALMPKKRFGDSDSDGDGFFQAAGSVELATTLLTVIISHFHRDQVFEMAVQVPGVDPGSTIFRLVIDYFDMIGIIHDWDSKFFL